MPVPISPRQRAVVKTEGEERGVSRENSQRLCAGVHRNAATKSHRHSQIKQPCPQLVVPIYFLWLLVVFGVCFAERKLTRPIGDSATTATVATALTRPSPRPCTWGKCHPDLAGAATCRVPRDDLPADLPLMADYGDCGCTY